MMSAKTLTAATVVGELQCDRNNCPCRVTARRGQGLTHCPLHPDRDPSLSVSQKGGVLLVKCHGGCAQGAVFRRVAELAQLRDSAAPEIVATYDYTDEQGQVLFQVVRFQPKDFRQRAPDGAGGWKWSLDGVRRVLYRLPDLEQVRGTDAPVYVCEGEKDADAIIRAGGCATSNPGGAGKWRSEYGEMLRDCAVVVVQDRDGVGRLHAAAVAESLHGIARSIRIVEAAQGKDASDHLAAGMILDELVPVELAPPTSSAAVASRRAVVLAAALCARCGEEDIVCWGRDERPYCASHVPLDMPADVYLPDGRVIKAR